MKIKNKIKIKVNGKKVIFNKNESIEKLIKKLKIPLNKVAIELNKKILNKKNINKIKLNNNDNIEIVHFIGGGWWKKRIYLKFQIKILVQDL